ncbi:type VI secretion system baseplate subunit TssG [Luteimonas sp. BDR2-5]|uniref:type VI secretion system baseplate subunit TssG n=1 Tax=Proluteimonas luteida TaxID=2878685 RepID=UPI001E5E658A|nr:type VI secretion system baseplate subunit TssG [Luteimonas sp. BDR2-5]MCD9027907.1 type VI secretion system baseplate subunit TssG [Luteimonas sp. BDR2-5]
MAHADPDPPAGTDASIDAVVDATADPAPATSPAAGPRTGTRTGTDRAVLAPVLQPVAALDALHAAPTRYRFFQAVRLLYRAAGQDASRLDGHDPVRFGVTGSLSFPPNEIDTLLSGAGDAAPRMVVNFFGLTGPSGTLPHAYTRWLIARERRRDHGPRDFFDIFNHRLLLLFWHAWRKHRPEVELEAGAHRGIARHIHDLIGLGTPALHRQLHRTRDARDTRPRLPAAALAYYSGLISQRPHGLGSISQVVGDVVGARVVAHGCFGHWQRIAAADRTRLGRQAHALGDGVVLGGLFWDRQTTVQLVVGPLDRARFDRLLPDGELLGSLVELTRFLTGLALDLRFRLVLRADQVPRITLSGRDRQAARLGWNTWLAGRRTPRPADDVAFHFHAMGDASWQ